MPVDDGLIGGIHVTRVARAEAGAPHDHEAFQASTLDALMRGSLRGDLTIGELLRQISHQVLVKRKLLEASRGKCHSVVLDLYEQWKGLEQNGQFRFTPPTHALVAFRQALREHQEQGGVAARGARYARNAAVLVKGMRDMGFSTLLGDEESGPIIQTFLTPRDANFDFEHFYEALRTRGFAIYPGKLTRRPSFRIGTIGQVDEGVMRAALAAIAEVLREMNVTDFQPLEA